MFAQGIVDKVLYARSNGSDNLTGGRYVAGTGEISPDGKVGPIGGIALKMQAARTAGATIFLAPTDNCGDVRGNVPFGLRVVRVDSLHAAIDDLKALRAGGSDASGVPSC
jgi:PDZ domain-containing protein